MKHLLIMSIFVFTAIHYGSKGFDALQAQVNSEVAQFQVNVEAQREY
jgi:hypothetical protein